MGMLDSKVALVTGAGQGSGNHLSFLSRYCNVGLVCQARTNSISGYHAGIRVGSAHPFTINLATPSLATPGR